MWKLIRSDQESNGAPGTPKHHESNNGPVAHASRASSATTASSSSSSASSSTANGSNSNANNQDTVFIPPKTPVRSKTRDTQYTTPSKLVSKSGMEHIH